MNKVLKNESKTPTANTLQTNLKTGQGQSKSDFVAHWVNSSSPLDDDDRESILSDSTAISSSVVDSDFDIDTLSLDDQSSARKMSLNSSTNNTTCFPSQSEILQQIFNRDSNIQTVGNVNIENSSQVHIGNVTYITGPVNIVNPNPDQIAHIFNSSTNTKSVPSSSSTNKAKTKVSLDEAEENIADREESSRNDAFLSNDIKPKLAEHVLHIVERRKWLAQKPMDPYQKLSNPAELVIISHSATEMASTMPDNVFLIRHIQCYHIESCRWNDIAYNFLIGNDGNVYEGRGWGVVGAHARGYNTISVGICFIGCFMRELPPAMSLTACKKIIQKGVNKGYISPDYKLIGHCQCSQTESPGRKLFEEIKTWDHFSEDIEIEP